MTGPLYSLRQQAVKKLLKNVKEDDSIVDYGCGSGTSIVEILEKAKKPIRIDGIDNSTEMLDLARERIKTINIKHKNVGLRKMDLSKKFKFAHPFDHAFASVLINHIPEDQREMFYKRVAENLKENGTFVIFQLVNKDKFNRIFSDWLLNVVPSHKGFPFLDEYC
jgi:ubiquinone/menaquinone biosynthesis C-methylase UbiE